MLLLATAATAGAQIGRRGPMLAEPRQWVGVALAFGNPGQVVDGSSGSTWNFGSATSFRLSGERTLANDITVGLAVSNASAPLRYTGTTATSACLGGCEATASFTQLLVTGRAGRYAYAGFQSSIEVGAGATIYSRFRRSDNDATLPPEKMDVDPTFTIGTNFAFAIRPTIQLFAVPEWGIIVHQRTGVPASSSTNNRYSAFRVGARYGF